MGDGGWEIGNERRENFRSPFSFFRSLIKNGKGVLRIGGGSSGFRL
jgi:hypothetical protein